jgi:hypothetical protein
MVTGIGVTALVLSGCLCGNNNQKESKHHSGIAPDTVGVTRGGKTIHTAACCPLIRFQTEAFTKIYAELGGKYNE